MFDSRFKSLMDLQKAFPTEQDCINYLEGMRWQGKVVSPFDPTSKVYKCKDTKNLRNNGRMRVKFDKWLVHIPFLCYLTILLNLAEGAVYGGY